MLPQRYSSDLTDAPQWDLIEPLLPELNSGGRREKHPRRTALASVELRLAKPSTVCRSDGSDMLNRRWRALSLR